MSEPTSPAPGRASRIVPTLVVHGGAGRVAPEHHEEALAGVAAAAEAGRAVLLTGGGCEAAVIAAVRVLEDADVFNAGRGACMTAAGTFEVDAGIMRSRDLASGALAAVPDLADAILVAQAVMHDGRHRLMAGQGAVAFARSLGVGRFDREAIWTAKAQARYDEATAGLGQPVGQADTVGAVAIDEHGELCVGCSTGGVLLKRPGRVGDSPIVGAGFYASPELGAACATGVGEAILTHVACHAALLRLREGIGPDAAADELCERVAAQRIGDSQATCGIILISPAGEVGVAHRSPHMSWAIARGDAPVEAGLQRPLACPPQPPSSERCDPVPPSSGGLPRPARGAYKARVHPVAWALAGALALAPATAPAGPQPSTASASAPSGRLVLGPDHRGTLTVVDEGGREVAVVTLRPGRRVLVELPPGRYTVRDATGRPLETVELEADEAHAVELPEELLAPASARSESTADPPPVSRPVITTGRLGPPPPEAEGEVELVRRRPWARWAAPLLSAIVPGAGQALNRQPGRGLAVFTGTVGLVLGTVATWAARDPAAGAMGNAAGREGREIARLSGFAGLSTAAGLLYLGQIMDAHAQAVDRRPPRPARDHVVALELSRSTTVGFAAGRPAYDLYSDWSLAIMGQVAPRVTLGLADASIKYARHRDMVTVQAGVRAAYRFFDRRRVWLSAGGGALLQGTRADRALEPLVPVPGEPRPDAERSFSAVPYLLFDARLFLLDRWSLGLVPRVSLPLAARRYGGGRALPRYATTFELGAVLGVYF